MAWCLATCWVFGPASSLVSSQGRHFKCPRFPCTKSLKGFLTINTVLMSLVDVWFSLLCLPDELDMDETVTESFLTELMAGGEPRKCYAHRVGSVQLGLDIGRSVFFVWLRGLTRTMTSNLLGRLGRAVSTPPHAALDTPPGSEEYSPTLLDLTL